MQSWSKLTVATGPWVLSVLNVCIYVKGMITVSLRLLLGYGLIKPYQGRRKLCVYGRCSVSMCDLLLLKMI